MSSSDSDSSADDEVEKKVASDSDSDDVTKRAKRASRSTKKTIESGGSSESDSDDDTSSKKKKESKKQSTKRKRKASGSSDDDRVDDSLFTDAEDKARWKALSELEKEQEIFERMEARENQRTREQIAQQLKAKKDKEGKKGEKRRKMKSSSGSEDEQEHKKKDSPPRRSRKSSDSDSDGDAEFHKPSDVHRKHKEKNAMAELKQKRKEIEKKHAKSASLSIDAVFGAQSSGSSSSSSSSASSRSSSRSSSRDSSVDNRVAEEEKASKREVETLDELKRARLSRFKLGKILHTPFFTKTVQGCFVKVGMGAMGGSESKYKLWQIHDVEETNKIYDVEGKRTNKGLKCKHGKQERTFRIAYVSNAEFSRSEFEEWLNEAKGLGDVPTMDIIEKKEADIKKGVEHKFSDSEVDALIKEKARFNKVPRNIAMTKADMSKRKEIAQQSGDIREAERIQKEIDTLEKYADGLDKKRSTDISAIAFINYRNRTSNKNEILSGQFKMEMSSQDDPFTRKKGGMKLVSGSKSKTDGTISASASGTNLVEMTVTKEVKIVQEVVVEKVKKSSPIKEKRKSTNMFDLHNSAANNLDFSINIDSIINSRVPRDDSHMMEMSSSHPPSFGGTSDGKSRGLSLADYRRRKAESAGTSSL